MCVLCVILCANAVLSEMKGSSTKVKTTQPRAWEGANQPCARRGVELGCAAGVRMVTRMGTRECAQPVLPHLPGLSAQPATAETCQRREAAGVGRHKPALPYAPRLGLWSKAA